MDKYYKTEFFRHVQIEEWEFGDEQEKIVCFLVP